MVYLAWINVVKIRFNPRQLVFDFWLEIHDNYCSSVHEKPHATVISNRMGAQRLGQARPNSVKATPILPGLPLHGEGPSMSIAEALAAYAYATPVADPATSAPKPRLTPDEIRRQRGQAIATICRIVPDGKDNRYRVPSQQGNGSYLVSIDRKKGPDWRCDCKDFETRGEPCKHVYAVKLVIDREKNGQAPSPEKTTLTVELKTELSAQASAKKPTYKQKWPAYNLAQTTEKHRFQELLRDLCKGVQEPPRKQGIKPGGRIRLSRADMIFAIAFKVYSTVSTRRFMCDLEDARERGYIDKTPHYNSIFNYLEDPELTPVLVSLVAESALPLRAVEVDFAVDSSGFTSSRFTRWFDQKYGVVRTAHTWVKVHLICGVKTNVVSAIKVGGKHDNDCPGLIPLVTETAKGFTINEVAADKQYLSYDNMDAVANLGGTPFIAFKEHATGWKGGTYAKMFHYYSLKKEEFFNHYHKRSNVESTFSMIKAKFGDHVRSKSDAAMINEALCKVLCHNVVVLIQSACELGIEATFWQKAPDASSISEVTEMDLEVWEWI
jgi:transposase